MTKKHFIDLANTIREYNAETVCGQPFTIQHIALLADFCETQNPRFDRDRWLGYIAGVNGPNGGKIQ